MFSSSVVVFLLQLLFFFFSCCVDVALEQITFVGILSAVDRAVTMAS
jgi:hypothetical protein